MLEKSSTGKAVVSYCTKCRLNLDHTIAAMEGETIVKVSCKTCGGTHKFRNPADAPKVRAPRAKKGGALKPSAEALWMSTLAGAKGEEYAYAMTAIYHVGDIILHDRFGKGVVVKLYPNKCEMLFQDKERLMASAN
jgi:hypothetical protein